MYKKKKSMVLLTFIFGMMTFVLLAMIQMDMYLFPYLLFPTFVTMGTMISLAFLLFFLSMMGTICLFVSYRYATLLFAFVGFPGACLLLLGCMLSTNNNETVFFSSPNGQEQFSVTQIDVLHNQRNDIYHIKHPFYAVQVAQIGTIDLENVFSQQDYTIRWHEGDRFTMVVPSDISRQKIDVTYDGH